MIQTMYQQYLFVIGKLKDIYQVEVDVNHRDVHTFYYQKIPVFKLLFGEFQTANQKEKEQAIVVSFHIDLKVTEAVQWWINIHAIHPLIKVAEVYVEDDKGESYLGEDARMIQSLKYQREILDHWLTNKGEEEMIKFAQAKVVGKERDYKKSYDSHRETDKAIIDFEFIKKPQGDGDIH